MDIRLAPSSEALRRQKKAQNKSLWAVSLFILAAVGLLTPSYGDAFVELGRRWSGQAEYSHGFFIPLVSLWALYGRRSIVARSVGAPSLVGFAFLILSLGLFLLARLLDFYFAVHVSFLLVVTGLLVSMGGFSLFRRVRFPLFYLMLSVPLPFFLEQSMTWELQLIAASLGVEFLRILGVSVLLNGAIIDLGQFHVQVAEACAGLRYLYPLFSLGVVAGYLFKGPLWARVFLPVSLIPATVVLNSVRIAVIGLSLEVGGRDGAAQSLHAFGGWAVFVGAAGVLLLEMHLLARFVLGCKLHHVVGLPQVPGAGKQMPAGGAEQRDIQKVHSTKAVTKAVPKAVAARFWTGSAVLAALLLTAWGANHSANRAEILPDREDFVAFPNHLTSFERLDFLSLGVSAPLFEGDDRFLADFQEIKPMDVGGAEIYLPKGEKHVPTSPGLRPYRETYREKNDPAAVVNFYAAYFSSQKNTMVPQSPHFWAIPIGWQLEGQDNISVQLKNGREQSVNRIIISHSGIAYMVYYWFEQRGRTLSKPLYVKFFLLYDSLRQGRTDGAVLRLMTPIGPVSPGKDIVERVIHSEEGQAAQAALTAFLSELDGVLPRFIPVRSGVKPLVGQE